MNLCGKYCDLFKMPHEGIRAAAGLQLVIIKNNETTLRVA
jgi:hypothetical protein